MSANSSIKLTHTKCPWCEGDLHYQVSISSYGSISYLGPSMIRALNFIEEESSRSYFDQFEVADKTMCLNSKCLYVKEHRKFQYQPSLPEKRVR